MYPSLEFTVFDRVHTCVMVNDMALRTNAIPYYTSPEHTRKLISAFIVWDLEWLMVKRT